MSYLSVSTWSLHRLLGPLRWTEWDADAAAHTVRVQPQPEVLSLLQLPAEAARRGYRAIEVCHFHFPSTETEYLSELKQSFAEANVSFDTLLLDYGDLTSEDEARRNADYRFIERWIRVAAEAGAKQIRVIAGNAQPTDEEALNRSASSLQALAAYASTYGVRVITENFRPLTSTGESSVQVLRRAGSEVGFITDFGNFAKPYKYEQFAMTLPYSVSVHAKAQYDADGLPDADEYSQCLDTLKEARYDGAVVLIYDGPGDMWEGLERIKRLVEPYL